MARKKDDTLYGTVATSIEGISTGYKMVDYISGVPGCLFPRATIIELYGKKSSSKTTLLLETMAYNFAINPKFRVLYADYEKMIRKEGPYLKSLGIDIESENFVLLEPSTMEEGNAAILKHVVEEEFDMIIIDTIAAMRPAVEKEKGYAENKQMGVKGKLMSEFCRNLMADLPANGPAVVFINQVYKDINSSSFIQQYNTPASDAVQFYAGIRIEVKETTKVKAKIQNPFTLEEEEIPVGSTIKAATTKNKVGQPFLTCNYMIKYGFGIDLIPSFIAVAQRAGAIYPNGTSKSSFLFKLKGVEQKPVVGMQKLIQYFTDNLDAAIEVAKEMPEGWVDEIKNYKLRLSKKQVAEKIKAEIKDYEETEVDEDTVSDFESTEETSEKEVTEAPKTQKKASSSDNKFGFTF